jgi:hypothetical protein
MSGMNQLAQHMLPVERQALVWVLMVLQVSQVPGALRMVMQALGQALAPVLPVPARSALPALVAARVVSWRLLRLMCASMEPTFMH